MRRYIVLFALFLTGIGTGAQLYKKPVYPKNYFRWPTELKPDIVANMGELRTNHWHMGLDVRTNQVVNQRVVATADGYISFVGIKPLSFGRWIVITHPNGLSTLYAHLNNFEPRLEAYVTAHQYKTESWETELEIPAGVFPVKKGEFIAYSGTTGGSAGPHVHWEIFDTKSERRLNPTLFVNHIADNIAPTVVRLAMYDRNNSTFDQNPQLFRLSKSGGTYTVPGGNISTPLQNISFAIEAYDTRNGTANRDGIYSARLFFDEKEISSFYIDSVDYDATRYMNCHVDYKMKANGGAWVQHVQKLPGDRGGVYYDLGRNAIVHLSDSQEHKIKIVIADANDNQSHLSFTIINNGASPPAQRSYEWAPNRLNRVSENDFEAYLPMFTLYDRMNSGYSRSSGTAPSSVSDAHKLGENYLPAHSRFEVRIKPKLSLPPEKRSRVVIRRTTGTKKETRKAEWREGWLTAQFRDFGVFEAFVDDVPPVLPSLGSGEVVNLNKASRITFTPTDNFGIADFRAEVDGKWLRFTNDKGRTWVYNFDNRIAPGVHTLTVTVSDIAGNKTTSSWKFSRGTNNTVPVEEKIKYKSEGQDDEEPVRVAPVKKLPSKPASVKSKSSKSTATKKTEASKKAGVAPKPVQKKAEKMKSAPTGKTNTSAGSTKKTQATKSATQKAEVKKVTKGKTTSNKKN